MGRKYELTAADGATVPVFLYKPDHQVKAVFLMLPALGVKARFYRHLAKELAEQGIATVLFEQRGHGESECRPQKGSSVGYDQYLKLDLPLAIDWAKQQLPGVPFFLGGHSLGAHLSNFIAADRGAEITGLIHMACVFPYHGFYPRKQAILLKVLCAAIPFLTRVLGYYPGALFGFGGKEHGQLMMDWREWAQTGCYDYGQVRGIEGHMANYEGTLLSISFEGDHLASEQALHKPNAVMSRAAVTRVHLTKEHQGEHIGHFEWARRPVGVVKTINDWIDKCLT